MAVCVVGWVRDVRCLPWRQTIAYEARSLAGWRKLLEVGMCLHENVAHV
jgi:hypothetical protein